MKKPTCPDCGSDSDVIVFLPVPEDVGGAESLRMYWCACGNVASEDLENEGSLEWGARKKAP